MPKKSEYSVEQMTQLATAFLPTEAVQVVNSKDFFFQTTYQQAFFFIEVNPALNRTCWIFLYHDKANHKLYLFDPEGLPLDKFRSVWFSAEELTETSLNVCHSWFIFSKYADDPEFNKTGVICIELAHYISKGFLSLADVDFLDDKKLCERRDWRRKQGVQFNFKERWAEDTLPLFKHLTRYPALKETNVAWTETEFSTLMAQQSARCSAMAVDEPASTEDEPAPAEMAAPSVPHQDEMVTRFDSSALHQESTTEQHPQDHHISSATKKELLTMLQEIKATMDITDEQIQTIVANASSDQVKQLLFILPAGTQLRTLIEQCLTIEAEAAVAPSQQPYVNELKILYEIVELTEQQFNHVITVASSLETNTLLQLSRQAQEAFQLMNVLLQPKRRFASFFDDLPHKKRTPLEDALLAQREYLGISAEEIDFIETQAPAHIKNRMRELCLILVWSKTPRKDASEELSQLIEQLLAENRQQHLAVPQ